MTTRTIFLARLIGLFLIIIALPMFWQKELTVETYARMTSDRPVILLLGMILTVCGLAMVLTHSVWTGGALPVVVTIIAWITLLKGAMILLLPPEAMINLFAAAHFGDLLYLYAAIDLAIGLFLTIAAFSTSRPQKLAGRPAESF